MRLTYLQGWKPKRLLFLPPCLIGAAFTLASTAVEHRATSAGPYTAWQVPHFFPNPEGCHNATGGLFGGHGGYRWQVTHWVFGVEAQGDWAGLTGSNPSLTATVPYMNQTKIDGIGLFTGQVGYAWNNVLWYMKGGAAVTDNRYSSFFTATGIVWNQANETRWGGALGTGIEFGFAPNCQSASNTIISLWETIV
jgi:hypothetical protein